MNLLQNESNSLGESTTRRVNINRAEPDPLLFRIPSDYTIVDQKGYGAASRSCPYRGNGSP
jgi:hypothetical protein